MSEIKKYRKFAAGQKTEIVLASLRGQKSMAELCREHEIADKENGFAFCPPVCQVAGSEALEGTSAYLSPR